MMDDIKLPAPDFDLFWRDGAYKVSKPNIGDTSVYTAERVRQAVLDERERIIETLRAMQTPLADEAYGHPREKAVEWAKADKWDSEARKAGETLDLLIAAIRAPVVDKTAAIRATNWRAKIRGELLYPVGYSPPNRSRRG